MAKHFKLNMLSALFAFLFIGIFTVSCSEDGTTVDSETVQNYVDQSVYSLQTEGNVGKLGCFEFIFPLSIEYPDGTLTEVEDYETLRSNLSAWIEANAELFEDDEDDSEDDEGKGGKWRHGYKGDIDWELLPSLVFPIEVVAEDGTVSSIEDQTELFELKRTCFKNFYGGKGRHGHSKGDRCFSLVFPISLVLADGSTITGEDRRDLKTQLRAWKETAEDTDERPSLQYPITIELEDGTTQEIANLEALQAAKDGCSDS